MKIERSGNGILDNLTLGLKSVTIVKNSLLPRTPLFAKVTKPESYGSGLVFQTNGSMPDSELTLKTIPSGGSKLTEKSGKKLEDGASNYSTLDKMFSA